MKKRFKILGIVMVCIFALIGLVFTIVFIAMQFGALNVRGSIATRNQFFIPQTVSNQISNAQSTSTQPCDESVNEVCDWNMTPEWNVVKSGLVKDAALITKVAGETGVSPRMIAAVVVPEQTRFFTSNREVFKRYFEPLKILGSMTQFSLGVSGIKQETANMIEAYAVDSTSNFYPGDGMKELITYESDANHDGVLFDRLTDDKNHYYSYLYTALFIKEIQNQWKNAGFDVSQNPEVITTLFNIGFAHSKPNASPQAAGAEITTGGQTYVYGQLGSLFYKSDELKDVFPQ